MTTAAKDAGAFSLNASIAMTMADAQIGGSQMLLRTAIPYDTMARAGSGGKRAFQSATELIVENMLESITKRQELMNLYGQTELALCASSANVDTTTTNITILLASWSAGLWAGMENCKLDAYYTNGTTLINSNAALVISTVNLVTRVMKVTGNATDIAALDSYIAGAGANVTKLRFYGAGGTTTTEFAGLDKIVTNSGTLFNISATTYGLWAGNSYAVSGALSFGKVLIGLAPSVNKGLMEDITLYVNPKGWMDLADDLAALRVTDSSYKTSKGELGNEELVYYYMGGKISVVAHLFLKEGEAYAAPLKRLKRIGAQDISFKQPGKGDDVIFPLSDRAGFEFRVYCDSSLFCEKIAFLTKFTGIVNSA